MYCSKQTKLTVPAASEAFHPHNNKSLGANTDLLQFQRMKKVKFKDFEYERQNVTGGNCAAIGLWTSVAVAA